MRKAPSYVPSCLLMLALAGMANPAAALRWESQMLGGFDLNWDNKISSGVQLRTERPNRSLIGKASLPENRNLCAPDDCIAVDPDNTQPNERFLAAPGATAMFTDDGNLNYPDRFDVTAATNKWLSNAVVNFGDRGWFGNLNLELGFLAFYDPVNTDFDERKPNQIVAVGPQPGEFVFEDRDPVTEAEIGNDIELRNFNVGFRLPFYGDRELNVRIGRQQITWGEALLALRGTLNVINPPEFTNLLRPGFELNELYEPIGMVNVETALTPNLSLQAFYEYEWEPFEIPPKGALVNFFDVNNDVAPDDAIALPFGKTPDDPNQLQTPANDTVDLITDTSFSGVRAPNQEPPGGGQYGFNLSWFTEALGRQGTTFGLYYANYHNRIPIASAIASDATCARREGNPMGIDATNSAEFFQACGFNATGPANGDNLTQRDALPLDTAQFFLEYPEDVDMFGLTYNTQAFGWAMQGEIAYRPNLPVQVDIEDVLFTAFQPVFPRETITILPDALDTVDPANACNNADIAGVLGPVCDSIAGTQETLTDALGLPTLEGAGGATLADSERALPTFLEPFRGRTPGEVAPGEVIRGFERLKNVTTSFNFTKLLGGESAPLGADQFVFLVDLSTSWLPDLPDQSELQFEGQGTFTHASPGIAETGDALKINPKQTTDGFVSELAWGYRLATLFSYENVPWPGANLRPLIAIFHDVDGVSPGLAANFVEDRKIIFLDLELQWGRWTSNLTQVIFAGGGDNNVLTDRDNINFSIGYEF